MSRLRVEVCAEELPFADLAPNWRRLHGRCSTATPFQSHAWLHSWWLSYGTPGRLRVHLVYRDDELIGAAPLMRVLRPLPALVPLGGPISDFTDVLLDDDRAEEAAAALTGALMASARGALIDLGEVRPGAAAERIHAAWPGRRHRLTDSGCLELPAAGMDVLLGRLPANRAQRARAKLRKIDALGIEQRDVPPDEVPGALRTLLELHGLQWQGRGVTREHTRPRFEEHLARAVGEMSRHGDAVVTEFRLDGEVVAADLTLLSPALAGGYLYGAHPGLRGRKVDVATMLLRACAQRIDGSGRASLSMLRGNEPYKQHWRPEVLVNQRFLLARRRTLPLLWASALHARLRRRAGAALRELRRRRDERSRPAAEPASSGPASSGPASSGPA
ncbi:GNAT family N-acetyltransferase [Streptomyces sp. NBC_00083]|uniref:GNAT family N-acetyltransferase n=1 Tax=Streptomyces sp. NBC_00083 TaxID=2975647 RepID=UPI0022539CEB|nr:GNAT family N-acetyltransferase [Streptomyces sp. NBC_00083]MCX5381762.1 GNAT family N-acetyltransferase [Streptomyces sp. NBC_00083]